LRGQEAGEVTRENAAMKQFVTQFNSATLAFLGEVQAKLIARDKTGEPHYFERIAEILLTFPIGGTLA
jgi:hypothetical protein